MAVVEIDGRVFDWVDNKDPKSRDHTIRAALLAGDVPLRKSKARRPGPTLDQGREGACTGFGCAQLLNASPNMRKPAFQNPDGQRIYKRAQFLDEWHGEAYEGSSVNGAMKAAREMGYVASWKWVGAGSGMLADDIIDTLTKVGGIEFGTYWFDSMMRPLPNGRLEVDTSRPTQAGHAYHGATFHYKALEGEGRKKQELILVQNSWGADYGFTYYGQGGFVYIRLEDMLKLMVLGGEGAVPIKP